VAKGKEHRHPLITTGKVVTVIVTVVLRDQIIVETMAKPSKPWGQVLDL
jgi:hypothetical protein